MSDVALQKRVSFLSKEDTVCPVCKFTHNREELLSGGGRLIAGQLTPELRRLYQKSHKYGLIYPLAYVMVVCPKCLYSAYNKDFLKLNTDEIEMIRDTTDHRIKLNEMLFGQLDFRQERNLVHGAASMIHAVDCYHLRQSTIAPTMKKAVSAIRAAWLLGDIFELAPDRPFDKVKDFYYMEAVKNYQKLLGLMATGKEPVEAEAYILGPDLDHNWVFDGVIYLNAYLTKKYIDQLSDNLPSKIKLLEEAKRYLSKLYGSGKSSKNKPSVIVDMAKDLYDGIGSMLTRLQSQLSG